MLLPIEMWVRVFAFLDIETLVRDAACVCRQWRAALKLLSDVDLNFIRLEKLCDWHYPYLLPLDKCVKSVAPLFPSAARARLSGSAVTNEAITTLVTSCPRLTSLVLTSAICVTNDEGFAAVLEHLDRLQRVCFWHSWRISSQTMAALAAKRGPRLIDLDVGFCRHVDDAVLLAVATHCSNLERLVCAGDGSHQITDDGVWGVLVQCQKLRMMDVRGSRKLTQRVLGWEAVVVVSAARPVFEFVHTIAL